MEGAMLSTLAACGPDKKKAYECLACLNGCPSGAQFDWCMYQQLGCESLNCGQVLHAAKGKAAEVFHEATEKQETLEIGMLPVQIAFAVVGAGKVGEALERGESVTSDGFSVATAGMKKVCQHR